MLYIGLLALIWKDKHKFLMILLFMDSNRLKVMEIKPLFRP